MELDLAEMRLGIKLSHQKIRGFFNERIVEFDNGTKWFLPDFISFQYGELDVANRAHKSVVDRLNRYELLAKIKGVASPLQGGKDKDKDKDMVITGGVGENGFVYNAHDFLIGRQRDLEKICMSSGKTMDQAKSALTKYHLWTDREGKYPLGKRQVLSGFQLWMMNEKDSPVVENKYEDQLTKARRNFKPTAQ